MWASFRKDSRILMTMRNPSPLGLTLEPEALSPKPKSYNPVTLILPGVLVILTEAHIGLRVAKLAGFRARTR